MASVATGSVLRLKTHIIAYISFISPIALLPIQLKSNLSRGWKMFDGVFACRCLRLLCVSRNGAPQRDGHLRSPELASLRSAQLRAPTISNLPRGEAGARVQPRTTKMQTCMCTCTDKRGGQNLYSKPGVTGKKYSFMFEILF